MACKQLLQHNCARRRFAQAGRRHTLPSKPTAGIGLTSSHSRCRPTRQHGASQHTTAHQKTAERNLQSSSTCPSRFAICKTAALFVVNFTHQIEDMAPSFGPTLPKREFTYPGASARAHEQQISNMTDQRPNQQPDRPTIVLDGAHGRCLLGLVQQPTAARSG